MPHKPGWSGPRRVFAAAWRIVAFLVLWGGLYAPLLVPLLSSASAMDRLGTLKTQLYVNTVGAITVVAAAWIATRGIDRRPLDWLEMTRFSRHLGGGMLLGTAMMAVAIAMLASTGAVDVVRGRLEPSVLALLGLSVLSNAVIQEVLFRGYVLHTILRVSNTTWALVISAVLFTIAHGRVLGMGVLPPANLFLAGLLLGSAAVRSGTLWLPIGVHFSWNYLQGPVLGLAVTGERLHEGGGLITLTGAPALTGGPVGLEGGLVVTLTTAAALFFITQIGWAPQRKGYPASR